MKTQKEQKEEQYYNILKSMIKDWVIRCHEYGIRQKEIAHIAQIQAKTISDIFLLKRRNPSFFTVTAIAEAIEALEIQKEKEKKQC